MSRSLSLRRAQSNAVPHGPELPFAVDPSTSYRGISMARILQCWCVTHQSYEDTPQHASADS